MKRQAARPPRTLPKDLSYQACAARKAIVRASNRRTTVNEAECFAVKMPFQWQRFASTGHRQWTVAGAIRFVVGSPFQRFIDRARCENGASWRRPDIPPVFEAAVRSTMPPRPPLYVQDASIRNPPGSPWRSLGFSLHKPPNTLSYFLCDSDVRGRARGDRTGRRC